MTYSFKIIIETVPAEHHLSKKPAIREYTRETTTSKMGRIAHKDKLDIDLNVNWNSSSNPEVAPQMQMEQIIRYTDEKSLINELRTQFSKFSANANVAKLKQKDNFSQTICFYKSDFTNLLPDFAIPAIALVLAENHATTQIIEANRNSFCSDEKMEQLKQKIQDYLSLKKRKLQNPSKSTSYLLNIVLIVLFVSLALILLQTSFLFSFVIGYSLMLAANLTTGYLMRVACRSYNTTDKIKGISNPAEKSALVAGYGNSSFVNFLKNIKHPIAFSAGYTLSQGTNENVEILSELITSEKKLSQIPTRNEIREQCLKACENRNKPITTLATLTQNNPELVGQIETTATTALSPNAKRVISS